MMICTNKFTKPAPETQKSRADDRSFILRVFNLAWLTFTLSRAVF